VAPDKNRIRIRAQAVAACAALVACSQLAFPAAADDAVRILFVAGTVQQVVGGAAAATASPGVLPGDAMIATEGDGLAQLLLADGTRIALQPGTRLRVGPPTPGASRPSLTLERGAIRIMTPPGLEPRVRVDAPDGAVSGAGHFLVRTGETFEAGTGDGTLQICTAAGCITLGDHESARARGKDRVPTLAATVSAFTAPLPTRLYGFQKGNEGFLAQVSDGTFGGVVPMPDLASGPGYATALAGVFQIEVPGPFPPGSGFPPFEVLAIGTTRDYPAGTATFSGGVMQRYVAQPDGVVVTEYRPTAAGGGTDGVIGWGRWTTGTQLRYDAACPTCQAPPRTFWNVHYIVGPPTPQADLQSLASRNAVGTYSLVGFTAPTAEGTFGPGQVGTEPISGSLTAHFGSGQISVALGVPIAGQRFSLAATVPLAIGPQFYGNAACSGTSSCENARVHGYLIGAQAARAGVVYQFSNLGLNPLGVVSGAAAFSQTSLVPAR